MVSKLCCTADVGVRHFPFSFFKSLGDCTVQQSLELTWLKVLLAESPEKVQVHHRGRVGGIWGLSTQFQSDSI